MSIFSIFLVLITIVCFLLVVVIMVQNPKGGGLSSSLGGSTQIGGVQKTTDFLDKSTWTLGGILILLLFGVMLTNKITNVEIKTGTINIYPAVIGVGLLSGSLLAALITSNWKSFATEAPIPTTAALGTMLIQEYALIFELLGIILLIALIGAASIARREA